MKSKPFIPYSYLGWAFVLVGLLYVLNQFAAKPSLKHEEFNRGTELQNHLLQKWKYTQSLFSKPDLNRLIEQRNYKSKMLNDLEKQHFYLVCTKKDSLYFWNSNQSVCDTSILRYKEPRGVLSHGNRTYLICQKNIGQYSCVLLYAIADKAGAIYLPPDHPFYADKATAFAVDQGNKGYKMVWPEGNGMANFRLLNLEVGHSFWSFLSMVLFAGVIFFGFAFFKRSAQQGLLPKNAGLLAALILLVRVLLYYRCILYPLQNIELFSPEIYASSILLASLGDLILHIICVFVLFYLVYKCRETPFLNKLWSFSLLKAFLASIGFVFATDMVFGIIKGLELNSVISFQFAEIPKSSMYSYISLSIIGLLIGGLLLLFRLLFTKINFLNLSKKQSLLLLVFSFLSYAIFQTLNGKENWEEIGMALVFCSLFYLWLFNKQKLKRLPINILALLLVSVFSAFILIYHNKKREKEHLQSFVDKIITDKDDEAEEKFVAMDQALTKEFSSPQDFKNFFKQQDEYQKRIKNLYFSGYLDKYELNIFSFDSLNQSINSNYKYSYSRLERLYVSETEPITSHHFYQLKNKSGIRGYMAKFENCNLSGNMGSVFLVLQPKIIQSSHSYPIIFEKKKQNYVFDLKDYSYAIYQNSKLVSQKGDYPYKLTLPAGGIKANDTQIFSLAKYNHNLYYPNDLKVIISNRKDDIAKSSSQVFFILFFFIFLGSGGALIWWTYYGIRFGWKKNSNKHKNSTSIIHRLNRTLQLINPRSISLSSRIQWSMASFVFIGLVVSVGLTIVYVRQNNHEKQKDQLVFKLKEVLNQLENEPDLLKTLKSEDQLRALVNQLSDANRIDLNIFDQSGLLLTSTKPEIYSEHFLAPVMNPEALYQLRSKNSSQVIQNETLTNTEYLSGYVPIIDDSKVTKAYLNLPYFTEKLEVDEEIEPLLVSLINIYSALLIFISFIAFLIGRHITKPIKLISNKLSKTNLGSTSETIDWDRDDEIGDLVNEYNKMLVKLNESTLKLSESEREGAWKEMARQVAHEIKNPLTPMKLNIQHLQRAWQNNPDTLDATFKRVTGIVIEQIESLSRLATEFSSFAQMPTHKFMDCRLDEILFSTLHLFEPSENSVFIYSKTIQPSIVYTDPDQIGRVFTNIFKNAIQSIPPNREGVITIDYTVQEKDVVISIKDNGVGMSEDIEAKIFVPSFSTKNSGMGLGLAISKKIIENSGGKIWFTTKQGEGSLFTISLPLKGLT